MKLINKSLIYLSVSMLLVIGIWAALFYHNKLDEIRKNADANLGLSKQQIIHRTIADSTIQQSNFFKEGFYTIREIPQDVALNTREQYADTMMYIMDSIRQRKVLEEVRILTTAFAKDSRFYALSIYKWMTQEKLMIKDLFRQVLLLYIALIASIILVNNLVLKRLWKPFYSFLSRLKNYQMGKTTSFPEIRTQTREFKDLQTATSILLRHSENVYEQQKQFIGNASHELQTPLAIASNKLELLIEKGSLNEDQAADLAKVLATIHRLIRFNKSLLLLSKIENKQFMESENIDLDQVILRTTNELQEIAEYKNITIQHKKGGGLLVRMDATLASIMVSNLVRNAIFHNVPGGHIQVETGNGYMQVSNTGKTEALNPDRIFQRFSKFNHDPGNSGLGLAIVKAILDVYGFSISYHYSKNLHCFTIRFSGPYARSTQMI